MKKSEIPWAYRDWSYEEMKAKGQFHEANEKATELDRLQAENAKLRKHCMMMATSPNQELLNRDREAYRADFPKETNNDK